MNKDEMLIKCAKLGLLDAIKYLVEHGADVHADDDYALIWTSYNGHLDVVKYLKNVIKNLKFVKYLKNVIKNLKFVKELK